MVDSPSDHTSLVQFRAQPIHAIFHQPSSSWITYEVLINVGDSSAQSLSVVHRVHVVANLWGRYIAELHSGSAASCRVERTGPTIGQLANALTNKWSFNSDLLLSRWIQYCQWQIINQLCQIVDNALASMFHRSVARLRRHTIRLLIFNTCLRRTDSLGRI